jgi:hypothetical protein
VKVKAEQEGGPWKVFNRNPDIVKYCHAQAKIVHAPGCGDGMAFKREMGLGDFRTFLVHFYAVSVLWVHFRHADEAVTVSDLNHQQLSLEEFTLALKTLTASRGNTSLSKEQIQSDFALLDLDKSGLVSFLEVVATCCRYIDPQFKVVVKSPVVVISDVPDYIKKLQEQEDRAKKDAEQAEQEAQAELALQAERAWHISQKGQNIQRIRTSLKILKIQEIVDSQMSQKSQKSKRSSQKGKKELTEEREEWEEWEHNEDMGNPVAITVVDISDEVLADLEEDSSQKLQGQQQSPKSRNLPALVALESSLQVERSTAEFVEVKHATEADIDKLLGI